MEQKKKSMAVVIKEFFGLTASEAVTEYKALSTEDKAQLASASARALNIPEEECSFKFVTY